MQKRCAQPANGMQLMCCDALQEYLRENEELKGKLNEANSQVEIFKSEISTNEQSQPDLANLKWRQIRLAQVFAVWDFDSSGSIEPDELMYLGKGDQGTVEGVEWTEDLNTALLSRMDTNSDGVVSCHEFVGYFEPVFAQDREEFDTTVGMFYELALDGREKWRKEQAERDALASELEEKLRAALEELATLKAQLETIQAGSSEGANKAAELDGLVAELREKLSGQRASLQMHLLRMKH